MLFRSAVSEGGTCPECPESINDTNAKRDADGHSHGEPNSCANSNSDVYLPDIGADSPAANSATLSCSQHRKQRNSHAFNQPLYDSGRTTLHRSCCCNQASWRWWFEHSCSGGPHSRCDRSDGRGDHTRARESEEAIAMARSRETLLLGTVPGRFHVERTRT